MTKALGAQFGAATAEQINVFLIEFGALANEADMPIWRLIFHLLKWATSQGRVPMLVRYQDARRWRDEATRVVALVYSRDPQAVRREAESYVAIINT